MTISKFVAMIIAAQLLIIAAACGETAAQVAATQPATRAAEEAHASVIYASREQVLIIAAYNGDLPAVQKLIAEGANINARFEISASNITNVWPGMPVGRPVAMISLPWPWPDFLYHAGNSALHEALSRDRLELAAYLLDHGADINADFAPIHDAVRDPKKLDFLIAKGADVNTKDRNGESALFLAVSFNDVDSVKKLLKARADVNARDDQGQTPLHFVFVSDAAMAKLLVAAGARVDVKDNRGFTPLMTVEWSVERIELDKAARLKGPPRPPAWPPRSYTYTRPGPPPEYEELERQGLKGEALAQRLNDLRPTETKAIAGVLKAAEMRSPK